MRGLVVRTILAALPGMSGLLLVSVGAGCQWGAPVGLMTAGALVLADAVFSQRIPPEPDGDDE